MGNNFPHLANLSRTMANGEPVTNSETLKQWLPPAYAYEEVSVPVGLISHSTWIVKSVTNEEEVQRWLVKMRESSKVDWRAHGSSYKNPKYPVIYKIQRRCHHSTKPRSKSANEKPSSKNTNCPMRMKISLERQKRTRAAYMRLEIYNTHNHPVGDASSLSKRSLHPETASRLIQLFTQGHGAADALGLLKFEKQQLGPEEYEKISVDRAIIPDINRVSYLYRKWRSTPSVIIESPSMEEISEHVITIESAPVPQTSLQLPVASLQGTEDDDTFDLTKRYLLDTLETKLNTFRSKKIVEGMRNMHSTLSKLKTEKGLFNFLGLHKTHSHALNSPRRVRHAMAKSISQPIEQNFQSAELSTDNFAAETIIIESMII